MMVRATELRTVELPFCCLRTSPVLATCSGFVVGHKSPCPYVEVLKTVLA